MPWAIPSLGKDPLQVPIDPNGNLASKTEGTDVWTYEWNAEDRLTRVTRNSVEQARFSYDPLGRRVGKVAAGVTTSYAYDEENILREVRGASSLKYTNGPLVDEPLGVEDGSALSYFHADALGSIVKVTNAAGVVSLTRRYDAWGNLETGASEPGYAFTGREWDSEAELYYYRERFYSPLSGRFLSEDPFDRSVAPNPYVYVVNNPVRYTDPTGAIPPAVAAFAGGVAAAASAIATAYLVWEAFWCNYATEKCHRDVPAKCRVPPPGLKRAQCEIIEHKKCADFYVECASKAVIGRFCEKKALGPFHGAGGK